MHPPRILRLIFLGLVLGPLAARAQVNVQFHLYDMGGELPSSLAYKSGNKYIPVKVTTQHVLASAYTYSGDPAMGFFIPGSSAGGSDSGPKMTQVGKIVFSGSGTFIVPIIGKEDGTVLGAAIPDSAQDLPSAAFRFINFSGVPVTMLVNDQKFVLNDGAYHVVSMTGAKTVTAHVLVGDKNKEVANQMMTNSDTMRTTVFLACANSAQLQANPNATPKISMMLYYDSTSASSASQSSGSGAPRKSGY